MGLKRSPTPGWGPSAPKGRPRVNTRPRRTQPVARFTTSGVIRLRVPRSSSGPQRPQFDTRLAISRNSASDMAFLVCVRGRPAGRLFHFSWTRSRRRSFELQTGEAVLAPLREQVAPAEVVAVATAVVPVARID